MIPLALVPSVSTPLTFIANSLIAWLNITIIMHQAMVLTVQACIFSPCIYPQLTCYSRPYVGTGYHQLLYCTLLATWNWVCWLLSQVEGFFRPLIPAIMWWTRLLSVLWGYSICYTATTGRCWLSQVSHCESDMVGIRFIKSFCFWHSGDCPNIIPHCIWVCSHQKLWWTGSCCIYSGMFQLLLPTMNLSTHTASLSINWRRQRSSGHMFLSLDRAVPQRFFILSPAKSRWRGTVGFINSGMGKSQWYGIGSLMWRSGISISSTLLTMQRQ